MLWTFDRFLSRRIKETPKKTALIFNDVSYTWEEYGDLTLRASQYFIDRNVKPGCNVGIWAVNSIEWLVAFAGLARIGAVPSLINVHYTDNELKQIVEYADIKLMCYSSQDGSSPDCGADLLSISDGFLDMLAGIEVTDKVGKYADAVKPEDTLAMLFTSGTTSTPKGVLLSHNSMIKVALDAAKIMHWDESDVNCLSLPLFHCFGLSTGYLAGIANGITQVMCKTSRTNEMLENIDRYGCTILSGVPTMYFAMVRNLRTNSRTISSLRSGIIAGAAVGYDDYKMISEVVGIEKLQMSYGQTESSPSITFSDYNDPLELKAKSVGRVIPDVELKIVDINTKADCPCGTVGEICIKGYNVMKGYYKKPEATAKVIDSEGWLHTEDLGRLDEDGNLYFEGRIKELIIRGGENISPLEIENYISKYPNVDMVRVVGAPDDFLQEKIVACIVPDKGCQVDLEGLDKFLRDNLAKYKIPEEYMIMKEFPLSASGKIALQDLKEIVKNRQK